MQRADPRRRVTNVITGKPRPHAKSGSSPSRTSRAEVIDERQTGGVVAALPKRARGEGMGSQASRRGCREVPGSAFRRIVKVSWIVVHTAASSSGAKMCRLQRWWVGLPMPRTLRCTHTSSIRCRLPMLVVSPPHQTRHPSDIEAADDGCAIRRAGAAPRSAGGHRLDVRHAGADIRRRVLRNVRRPAVDVAGKGFHAPRMVDGCTAVGGPG